MEHGEDESTIGAPVGACEVFWKLLYISTNICPLKKQKVPPKYVNEFVIFWIPGTIRT